MTTFRILDQAPQYLLPDGRVNAGGSLTFYETDLSTPKLTWSDPDLTTPNPNPLPLDAAGRTQYDVWGEGEYGAVMRDADGVAIWTRNNVRAAGDASQEIPALVAGRFLGNDGSNLQWLEMREVPDPSGSNGYILSTDGTNLQWIPQPELPELPIANTANSVKIGSFMLQWGTGSAPASGFRQTGVSVTFPVPFSGDAYHVDVSPTNVTHTAGGQIGVKAITARSSTAFSVQFDTDDYSQSNAQITSAIPFTWVAFGPTT